VKKNLRVRGLSTGENRSDLVRIHAADRNAKLFPRWTVGKLTCNGRSRYVVVLGQDTEPGAIELDFDHRAAFDVKKQESYDFELKKAGPWGQICYLLQAHDPMLKLPTWIALISLLAGVLLPVIQWLVEEIWEAF
jgi:hypothetical protein